MRNRRRNRNNVNTNMMAIEREHTYADDVHYFIEKIRNKGNKLTTSLYSNDNDPGYLQRYIEFMQQYIKFTLTNISEVYDSLSKWIEASPTIRSKIQFIDSNDIASEVSSYVTAYLDKKLYPSVKSVALSLLGIEETATAANFETHNIPAVAFLGPPGTSKTYSIVAALKDLSEGQGNNKIAGWLHYDITKHDATTSPLILPTANQDVKDDPLPGLAMLRAINNPEIDKALSESIYTKTVNKIISTFAYILIAGKEIGRIQLSNEVENTLKKGIDFSSIELDLWKFVVTNKLDENSIEYLSNAFKNVIHGFTKVTEALYSNKALIDNDASQLINAISNIRDDDFELSDPASYVRDFRKVAWTLHKFITFSLVPIIALTFRKFVRENKIVENTEVDNIDARYKNMEILNGIMYIYNKIHSDYLHRIISTVFLIKALVSPSEEYEDLFSAMIRKLSSGLHKLLNDYANKIKNSDIDNRLALEKISQELVPNSSENKKIKTFNFYHKIYMFLLNIQAGEQSQYVLLDQMFINTVLSELLSLGGDSLHGNVESEGGNSISQYRDNKFRRYSSVDYIESEVDYFSNSKLSFVDHISLLSDIINDLHEVRRFYSNMPIDIDSSGSQDSQTTLEKLKGEFGRSFLDLGNTGISNVREHISTISTIFKFIDLIKSEYAKGQHKAYKDLYKNKKYKDLFAACKDALKELFTKSLSVIVYNPSHGHILEMASKAGLNDSIIYELIGEYMLSALDITESLRTKGISYSFPPAVQVFLARAKEAYYKYLKDLRAMIASNLKLMDITSSLSTAMATLKPPLYVLFIDEIMTQMTQQNFLFWLNIWNGLISPVGKTVDTYPPNLCFILAGNMPADARLLGQVLAQSSTEQDIQAILAAAKGDNLPLRISNDTLNALGSRIRVKVVTYDYAYLLRTDESIARKRTALFIKALTNGLLRQEGLIKFANTAQDLLGGFYDYYKLIVEPRLEQMGELVLSDEERMRLHAYIISLTAAPDNIPFNIKNIVPNSTIKSTIDDTYRDISLEVKNEVIRKATILNHLFNNKTFGKTIYEYMFGDYFENNSEAVYFNRLITIAISPIILHLSFTHSYLVWNNMMRRVSKKLLDKAATSKDNPEIVLAVTRLMKEITEASKLLNTRMTNHNSISTKLGIRADVNDRIERLQHAEEYNSRINFIKNQSDPRLCDPEVGAVVSLLSLVFYHYIKYMKEFNVDISNSIITFCRKLEAEIQAISNNKEFNELKLKIRNYFVDPDQDIKTREDYLKDASVFEYNLDMAVRINLLSFKPDITTVTLVDKKNGSQSSVRPTYKPDFYNSITVTLIPNVKDSDTGKGLTKDDIEAIKSLVAYTIYTHSLVMKKGADNMFVFSDSLIDNILVTNAEQVPLVGNLVLDFFRATKEEELFLIDPLRETDRWFTNVTSSVVKYVTIMTILKHILTYNRQAGGSMINEFLNVAISSNNMTQDVKIELESILNDFSNLLFLARKAVFTPLADGGKAASNNQYIKFTYKYYGSGSAAGEAYEGYYIRPDNQVNFGRLDFVFKELKTSKIVQYEKPTDLIETIAKRFLQYIKNKDKRSTTSFFPIHLISHINLSSAEAEQKEKDKTIQDFSNLGALIYNNSNIEQITNPSIEIAPAGQNLKHDDFYEINDKEYSINSIAKVLNNRLESIKALQPNFNSIDDLLRLNKDWLDAAKNSSNLSEVKFTHLLLKNVKLHEIYQMINLNDGIFEHLQKVKSRYPSVTEYIKRWNNEKGEIVDFFKSLVQAAAQSNVEALTKTVVGIYDNLNKYILEITEKLLEMQIEDKNVKAMLNKIKENKDQINKFLEEKIKEVMTNLDHKYIEHQTSAIYRYINENDLKLHIEYQNIVLTPLIKYSLAIILSNIFLIESRERGTFWSRDKYSFYQELEKAIRNSYNKTIDPNERDSDDQDYLSMIIRYILFDMNQQSVDNGQIRLSGELLKRTLNDLHVSGTSGPNGFHLVKPFFTSYDKKKAKIEGDTENNKKVITKREVFTQYVYTEDQNGIPSLYCDIHHMPIKAVQFVDGTEKKVSGTIKICSSEPPQRNPDEYVYTQLTFMQNRVVPRYEFAKSVLVNLLLIAGIQDIQRNLITGNDFRISNLAHAQFASFAVTNLYLYYINEIKESGNDGKKFIDMVIKNSSSHNERKPLHPLLASIMLLFNSSNEEARMVKELLKVDYDYTKGTNQYSRRDDLINALRLRFYSSEDIGMIKSTEYEMYSIYEPGVSIELGS